MLAQNRQSVKPQLIENLSIATVPAPKQNPSPKQTHRKDPASSAKRLKTGTKDRRIADVTFFELGRPDAPNIARFHFVSYDQTGQIADRFEDCFLTRSHELHGLTGVSPKVYKAVRNQVITAWNEKRGEA